MRAYDTSDGSTLWTYNQHSDNVDGLSVGPEGYIYTASRDDSVHKVAPDGAQVWTRSSAFSGNNVFDTAVSPDGSTVLAGYSISNLVALNANDGSTKWTAGTSGAPKALASAPSNSNFYVGDDSGTLTSFAVSDGTQEWTGQASTGESVKSVSAFPDGETVYGGTGIDDNLVFALDSTDGARLYQSSTMGATVGALSAGGEYKGPSTSVTGTVTDPDGSGLNGATVTGRYTSNNTVFGSTTTNSTGGYDLPLPNGDFEVTYSKSGFADVTKSVTIAGSNVQQDAQLKGNLRIGVTNQNDAPVQNATVEVVTVDRSQLSGATEAALDDAEDSVIDASIPDTPTTFADQTDGAFGLTPDTDTVRNFDSEYALLYDRQSLGANRQLSIFPDNADFSSPQWQDVPAGERLVVTSVDPGGGAERGFRADEYDQQVYGDITGDKTVKFERLVGPGGTSTTTVTTDQTYDSGTFDTSTLQYGSVVLSPGFYRVTVDDSDASYVIKVGDPLTALADDLQDEAGNLLPTASEAADAFSQNIFTRTTVVTDANGEASVSITDSNVETVLVQAYKAPGSDIDPSSLTLADVRAVSDSADAPSVYFPSRPQRVNLPGTTTVTMRELSFNPYANQSAYEAKLQDLVDRLANETLADLPPALQERLDQTDSEKLEDLYTRLRGLQNNNEQLQERYREVLATLQDRDPSEVGVALNGSDATDEELRERIQALQTSLTQVQDQLEVLKEAGEITEQDGKRLLSRTWTVSGPLGGSVDPDAVLVRVTPSNGSGTQVLGTDSEYLSVEDTLTGGTEIQLTDYPLGDAATAQVALDVATDDGLGGVTEPVRNPSFAGDIPGLQAVTFSSLQPGPDERVTGEVVPAAPARFGALESVTVVGPDGSELSTSQTGEEFGFTTTGAGPYRVELVFSNPSGIEFTEVQYLSANSEDTERPPGIRTVTGPTGTYALAGDGLESARVETAAGGTETTVTAILPENQEQLPSTVHVYTAGLDLSPDADIGVRVVKGAQERALDRRVNVVLHSPAVPDGAHIRVNGDPLPPGTSSAIGSIDARGNGTTVDVLTDPQGRVDVTTNADPGILDQIRYTVDNIRANNDIPFLGLVPADGVVSGLHGGVLA